MTGWHVLFATGDVVGPLLAAEEISFSYLTGPLISVHHVQILSASTYIVPSKPYYLGTYPPTFLPVVVAKSPLLLSPKYRHIRYFILFYVKPLPSL
jgi:hypothetical protein